MDWVPVVFVAFKILVFGAGMFFAIKWHYDQDKKGHPVALRGLLLTAVKFTAVFVLLAAGLLFVTFAFAKWLGMDLSL